ncbi:MAG: hypothetical protein A2174_02445 [Candidatus Portnoybacteria bacterium RBG_13_41_18]|uniref:Uncharacterized protein n=1 Tax=Candidatus Portnoybacteria bacterium RBG_13_41_18 TaxID=1801991 RepID=A0A1G2FAF4_9BACT|nr:MAG: hypothetical protein A2174_02445 [Candidatus Portnoybacteria bacterium RBG_13_41_18]
MAVAGKSADLPGAVDAYLRNELHDYKIVVIGVGLPGSTVRDALAAELSITDIPGTQVIYAGTRILRGCAIACTRHSFEIKPNEVPIAEDFNLEQALSISKKEGPDTVSEIKACEVIMHYEAAKNQQSHQ